MPTSRRNAAKTIAAGLGGLLAGNALAHGRMPQPARKLGVALVGLGNYSTAQLAPALGHTANCYLAGIVTGSPEKAVEWKIKYNLPGKNIYNYKNFDQIAHNPDIDIVYVVLPNFLHAEYTVRAAQAGKHVLCEKPLALNTAEADQMLAACRKAKVKFGVGYRLYYEPHHQEAVRLAKDEKYGKMKLIESSLGFTRPGQASWRLDKRRGGGGAIMDLGVYAIQGARRMAGAAPLSVTAQAFTFDKVHFKDIHETVFWQFEFPGGVVSHSSTSYSSYVDRLYATCERGWFEVEPAFNAVGTKGRTSEGEMRLDSMPFQQIKQLEAFADSVLHDSFLDASGEEGRLDIRLIEAIMRAVETGTKVMLG